MRRMLLTGRMLIGLTLIVGTMLIGTVAPASANHGAQITIHKAVCDSDVWDIFGQCHDDRLGGVPFYVAGVWRSTDGAGVVSWEPGAGTHTIWEDWDVYEDYNGAYVFCSNQVTGAVLWDGPANSDGSVTITTTAGQWVVCDWYNRT